MAVWQVAIEFVPKNWAKRHQYKTEQLYNEDGYDAKRTWLTNQPDKNINDLFDKILDRSKSWSDDLTSWRNADIHDISVWRKEGIIEAIGFRLDLRQNVSMLLNSLVNSAIELNCVLFIPGQQIMFKPKLFELKQYVLKSNAARFIQDPEGFLRGIGE